MIETPSTSARTTPDGRPEQEQPRWRRDFPVDIPEDQYVARRDFTKFLVLTSLAFAAGQVWIVIQNFIRKRRGQSPVVRIASVEEVAVGQAVTFNYPEPHDGCILLRKDEQTFIAYSQKCTHLSCAVIPEPDRGRLFCPCHEGIFDLATGRPLAGPPRRPLPRITLQINQGVIYAAGVEPELT